MEINFSQITILILSKIDLTTFQVFCINLVVSKGSSMYIFYESKCLICYMLLKINILDY